MNYKDRYKTRISRIKYNSPIVDLFKHMESYGGGFLLIYTILEIIVGIFLISVILYVPVIVVKAIAFIIFLFVLYILFLMSEDVSSRYEKRRSEGVVDYRFIMARIKK